MIETGDVVVDIDGDEVVTAASLIRIPILLTACKMSDEGRLDLDAGIRVAPGEKVGGAGVLSHLTDNLPLPLRDLLTLMMIVSDNTATNLCIDAVGPTNISDCLTSLQCTGTSLGRRLMDFAARKAGRDNVTTANDVVRMMKALCTGGLLREESKQWAINVFKGQQFNHTLPRLIPVGNSDDAFIAHKTGELPGVEHDAGFMERGNGRAYVAVLSWNLTSNVAGQDVICQIGKLVWDHLEGHN